MLTCCIPFPCTSQAAQMLLSQREVVGLGIDTPSVDVGLSIDFPVHRLVLSSGEPPALYRHFRILK